MKIHFIDPRVEDTEIERGECGRWINEDGTNMSRHWKYVTCKFCLKRREAFEKYFQESEAHIIRQMGEMAAMHGNT